MPEQFRIVPRRFPRGAYTPSSDQILSEARCEDLLTDPFRRPLSPLPADFGPGEVAEGKFDLDCAPPVKRPLVKCRRL
jgi:hypothetical protein